MREWLCVHWIAVFLALILTGGACLRVVSFIGYGYDGDDVGYAQLAHNIVTGEFLQAHLQTPLIFPSRISIVAPASASFKLFGVSELTLGVYPFIVSMLGIVLGVLGRYSVLQ